MRTVTDHKSLVWIGARPTEWLGAVNPMPADMAVGTTQVTFSGVNAGTEIRVYLPDGTEIAGIELCAADQVLPWQVYAAGSPNNTVTVRLVHPAYKIKEFSFASSLGAVSLPVQQERDKWYSNPV